MARNKYPEVTIKRILDASLKLFLEKGYEQTTIQDIINELGDLSKGAIYHHFNSKEEIIEAVSEELFSNINGKINELRTSKDSTGLEKLRQLFRISLQDISQKQLITAVPNLLKNPKFLAEQLYSDATEVAPIIQVFIEEGIADKSITARHPKELSEVLILLSNIWLNPMIFEFTAEELHQKFVFFKEMTDLMGIPILGEDMLEQIENYRKLTVKE
jgi:AcrR family transcriptional regulator